MKTVTYFGVELEVPDWANYIAKDDDGDIWCYEFKPNKSGRIWRVDKGESEMVWYTSPISTLVEV